MKTSDFSSISLLIAGALALFAMSILLHAYDNDPQAADNRSGPGSYSISALGYAGLFDTLRRMDRPVLRGAGKAVSSVGYNGTLVVAEPDMSLISSSDGLKLMKAPRLLLVLPKWRGRQSESRPAWIEDTEPVPLINARRVLALVDGRSDVYRDYWPTSWEHNEIGFIPSNPSESRVVQLIRSKNMRPLVAGGDGILLGEVGDGDNTVWVLSDPDIMANHGLGKGENAAFMTRLMDMLRSINNSDLGAPIVFDETVHGFVEQESTPLKLLFRFPFVIVVFLLCCTAALTVAAGVSRFGPALNSRPELDFGKKNLVGNGARLLDYGGHHTSVLKRYVRMNIRLAVRSLRMPKNLTETEKSAWLDRLGTARGVKKSCSDILRDMENVRGNDPRCLSRLSECAQDIHNWKGVILNESSEHKRHSK